MGNDWINAIMKKIKERMTENAWNNLGQLNWTLPKVFVDADPETWF